MRMRAIGRAGRPARDLTGRRFGRLKVIKRAANRGNHTAWRCRCDCGKVTFIRTSNLTTGRSQSCGCLQRERAGRPKKDQYNKGVVNISRLAKRKPVKSVLR